MDLIIRCRSGLSQIAVKELKFANIIPKDTKVNLLKQRNYDFVFIKHILPDVKKISKLRTIDDAFDCLVFSKHQLSSDKIKGLVLKLKSLNKKDFKIVTSTEDSKFNAISTREYLERELKRSGIVINKKGKNLITFFGINDNFYIGYKIIGWENIENRHLRKEEREASLPSPIAASLAFLSNPKNNEVVLDPVCGSGTLLFEAYAYNPNIKLIGIDIDNKAVAIAKENLKKCEKVSVFNMDIKSADEVIKDKIDICLANLPFGHTYGDELSNKKTYSSIFEILNKIASNNFRGIMLTSDAKNFRKTLKYFYIEKEIRIHVKGIYANIYVIKKS